MTTYRVIRKSDGAQVYEYSYETAVTLPEYPDETHEHVAQPDQLEVDDTRPVDVTQWRIYVGAFFDRFGSDKVPILASDNAIVQAMIKDASVRQYIGLVERKAELTQMLGMLQTLVAGINLDVTAILETEPTAEERWSD